MKNYLTRLLLHSLQKLPALLLILLITFGEQAQGQGLLIRNGAQLIVKGSPALVINNGSFYNNGQFKADSGSVKFTGNADSTIAYIAGSSASTFNQLIVNKAQYGLSLRAKTNVYNSVTVSAGTLYSKKFLTLLSSDYRTAVINSLPVNGAGVATAFIKGELTVNRFIQARKAWRLLSAPVYSGTAPTIHQAWQEGLTTASANPNLYPGFGTHITGGTVANGYDQGPTVNTSIKIYNNTTNAWTQLPTATGTNIPITNYQGYFVYIRGDRSFNMSAATSAPATKTILEIKGEANTGRFTVPVNAKNYTVVGNPYACPIDFHSLTKNNVSDIVYLWDPKMAGAFGLGAYVTLSWNSAANRYDATSCMSPITRYIPSGEAFLVRAADSTMAGSITFNEGDKSPGGHDPLFGRVPDLPQSVRVDMILPNADSTYSVIDGTLSTFDESYSSDVDYSDAGKLTNTGENIAFKINNQLIAIERRKNVTAADTLFLNISQMKYQTYQLQVTMENMDSDGNLAFLKDNFMPSNNIPLNMNGVTTVPFSITTATGSWAPNRFSIVFAPAVIVPLLVTKIKATPVGKNIRVDWAVEYEMNLSHYEVQKSVDGISFNVIGQVATRNTGNSALYDMIDENVVKGMNYYRIVAVERDGTKVKTDVVSVNIKEESVKQSINIFPNPVTNNKIQLQFVGQQTGLYAVRLTNIAGQVLYTGGLSLSSGTSAKVVELSTILTPGVYQLEIYGPDHSQQTQKLIVQ